MASLDLKKRVAQWIILIPLVVIGIRFDKNYSQKKKFIKVMKELQVFVKKLKKKKKEQQKKITNICKS